MTYKFRKDLLDVKASFKSLYDSVRVLGSGDARFVRICNASRRAVVHVSEEGWHVDLWSATDSTCLGVDEESLIDERTTQDREEAIDMACEWLDGS